MRALLPPAPCAVCAVENAAYKCPKCEARYCSVKCCKEHKISSCLTAATPQLIEKDVGVTEDVKKEEEVDIDSRFKLLTEDSKRRLEENPRVQTVLKSKRLRQDLEKIDSGGQDRQRLLRLARSSPEFEQFVTLLLRTIGNDR